MISCSLIVIVVVSVGIILCLCEKVAHASILKPSLLIEEGLRNLLKYEYLWRFSFKQPYLLMIFTYLGDPTLKIEHYLY